MADSSQEQIAPSLDQQAELEAQKAAEDAANKKIVEDAKAFFALAKDAENEMRLQALEDLEFISGKQWPAKIQQDRELDGRPCLVINRLPQFVQQVTNDQRQNRPSIKVHPVSDGADVETARVIQGLIRHIEYNSNAEVAYDTALEGAARGGFGYFRIIPGFASHDSFDQEIFIRRVRNPLSVYFDPFAQEPDGSDARRALIVDKLSRDDYKAEYPDSELSAVSDWEDIGDQAEGWFDGEGATVAEFFYKDSVPQTLHLLSTGVVLKDHELEQHLSSPEAQQVGAHVVQSRVAKVPQIKWCKLNGIEVLEQTVLPGSFIPIIPVYGSEIIVNGKRILESVVRHAKDPQKMLNFQKSAEAEAIALAPKAPFIVAEGQLEGYENDWANANRRNYAYLYYKPTTIAGQPAPPPERQNAEPAVQAISQAIAGAQDDLKSTTGIYDSALGAMSNEVSGVAIKSRASQAQQGTFHFTDNLKRSMRHAGRILVEWIPHFYDTARTARIIGEDGTQDVVLINQKHTDPDTGKEVIYDLSAGRYDATVDTGPSFASKRDEAANAMVEVARVYPKLMDIAGDLFIKNQDWPGAQEIAERIKITLPPEVQNGGKGQQIPPQIQAQLQQAQEFMQKLTDENNELTKVIETKQLEIASRERIEMRKVQADLEINAAKLGSAEDIALMNAQIGALKHQIELLQAAVPVNAPTTFDPEHADGGNFFGEHVGSGPTGGPVIPGSIPGENP